MATSERYGDASQEEIIDCLREATRRIPSVFSYSPKIVGWEDVTRGTIGGELSSIGSNISDVWLEGKLSQRYYTFRTDNWNEQLCQVSTDSFAIVTNIEGTPTTILLKDYLENIGKYCYDGEGIPSDTVINHEKINVRFQYCIVNDKDELTPCVYNYQTISNNNPKNIHVMFNTQSSSISFSQTGKARSYLHSQNVDGGINKNYIQVEDTSMAAGSVQVEDKEATAAAAAAGKATVATLGTRKMGQACNIIGMLQIPIKQEKKKPHLASKGIGSGSTLGGIQWRSLSMGSPGTESNACFRSISTGAHTGTLNVGRASIGSSDGVYTPPNLKKIEQEDGVIPTMTITYYAVCSGGVPDDSKIGEIMNHMDTLYQTVGETFDLASATDQTTSELTVHDALGISHKLMVDPHPASKKVTSVPTIFEF